MENCGSLTCTVNRFRRRILFATDFDAVFLLLEVVVTLAAGVHEDAALIGGFVVIPTDLGVELADLL